METLALVYLALCGLFVFIFFGTLAVNEIRWRRRQRKRAKTAYIRDWRIT